MLSEYKGVHLISLNFSREFPSVKLKLPTSFHPWLFLESFFLHLLSICLHTKQLKNVFLICGTQRNPNMVYSSMVDAFSVRISYTYSFSRQSQL